jgi:hypothetical protein
VAAEAAQPFDLEEGPLTRFRLVRLTPEDHVLLVICHHIISDAWSAGVFFRELRCLYEAFSRGAGSPLPDPAIQYGDYAVHERAWLRGEVLEKHIAWWRGQLAGAPPVLDLPTDRPRSSRKSFAGSSESVPLSRAASNAIRQLCRTEGVTLFTALMGGFQALLWRYSGEPQILTGTDVANRNAPELENTLGFFINVLPIRTDFSGDPGFRDVLGRLQQNLFGAYAHQQLPFARMVQEIQPERNTSYNPLVQALFVLQNAPRVERALAGLEVDAFPVPLTSAKFDLAVFMSESGDDLIGRWVYSTDLFERATVLEMISRFERLVEAASLHPDIPLGSIALAETEETERKEAELAQARELRARQLLFATPEEIEIDAE